MTQSPSTAYGIRLAIVYAIIWFVDLLDSTSLNVSVTAIANALQVLPANAEWIVMGFFFSMTIAISISGWLGLRFGTKRVILFSQVLYIAASVGCALSTNLTSLTLMRSLQGFAGGIAIPLGLASLLHALPKELWAKATANINVVTLVAPALGPLFGVYATELFGWQAIFLIKLPVSMIALALSVAWLKEDEAPSKTPFDLSGFAIGTASLLGILWVLSEMGKGNGSGLLLLCLAAFTFLGAAFVMIEKRKQFPLIPMEIFRIRRFSMGNFIQITANAIFLGGNFIIGLYLQDGLGHGLVEAGWVMACISPGMIFAQPFLGRYYNKIGAMPFMLTGMGLLTLCTLTFAITTPETPLFLLGSLVFCIGIASSLAQSSNVIGIFASLPPSYKGSGSSLYSLFKQLSASFGVALSAMVFSLAGGSIGGIASYHVCFAAIALVPAAGFLSCFFIQEKATSPISVE